MNFEKMSKETFVIEQILHFTHLLQLLLELTKEFYFKSQAQI